MPQDKYGDLARMYALFRRVDGGLDLLRQVTGCRSACGCLLLPACLGRARRRKLCLCCCRR